jgi:hypothetical protein
MFKAPGTKSLQRKCDELLSNVGFEFNLRGYTTEARAKLPADDDEVPLLTATLQTGRGLHSSTSQLNLSRF